MGSPLTFTADTASPLYLKTPIDRRWARRVRRHQDRLVVSLLAFGPAPAPSPAATPPRPLPWTIADLHRPPSKFFSSQYHGVGFRNRAGHTHPWEAYRVAASGKRRKKLGDFATQELAAWAALKDRNPLATDSTGVVFPDPSEDDKVAAAEIRRLSRRRTRPSV